MSKCVKLYIYNMSCVAIAIAKVTIYNQECSPVPRSGIMLKEGIKGRGGGGGGGVVSTSHTFVQYKQFREIILYCDVTSIHKISLF